MKIVTDYLGSLGIIIADWDINEEFAPRTLTVDYTSWISYISRKKVPAGIEITNDEYWKPIGRIPQDAAIDYNKFKAEMERQMHELDVLVETFLQSSGGTALTNEFGDSEYVGITQKSITKAINSINEKLNSIIGISTEGINMSVTPTTFTGEDGAQLNISFDSSNNITDYTSIKFYANGELIKEYEDIEQGSFTHTITERTVIKCVAVIMGKTYTKEQTIDKVTMFYIGGGTQPSDVVKEECRKDITDTLEGSYNITVEDNDNIYIVMDAAYDGMFNRADMNGFAIPFTKSTVTIDDIQYIVYASDNKYNEGTYEIYINR